MPRLACDFCTHLCIIGCVTVVYSLYLCCTPWTCFYTLCTYFAHFVSVLFTLYLFCIIIFCSHCSKHCTCFCIGQGLLMAARSQAVIIIERSRSLCSSLFHSVYPESTRLKKARLNLHKYNILRYENYLKKKKYIYIKGNSMWNISLFLFVCHNFNGLVEGQVSGENCIMIQNLNLLVILLGWELWSCFYGTIFQGDDYNYVDSFDWLRALVLFVYYNLIGLPEVECQISGENGILKYLHHLCVLLMAKVTQNVIALEKIQ